MATSAINMRYFILGLLTSQPMSGYDIKRFLERLRWLIGSPSFGSLYPALHALLDDALVTVDVISREDKPSRKIYNITETGKDTLVDWLRQPVTEDGVSLKAFVMRLMLAGNFTQPHLVAHLQQRRLQVADQHADLEQIAEISGEMDLGQRLSLDYAMTLATAELRWLDQALEQVASDI